MASEATFLFSPPDYGKDILWDDSANPPEVRGATPEKLVEKLCHEQYYDPTYVIDFLFSYPSFMSSEQLMDLLLKRWKDISLREAAHIKAAQETARRATMAVRASDATSDDLDAGRAEIEALMEKANTVRKRFIKFLQLWVENHWIDFRENPSLLEQLQKFLKEHILESPLKSSAKELFAELKERESTSLLDGKRAAVMKTVTMNSRPPDTLWRAKSLLHMKKGDDTKNSLLDFHPHEIARQMSLIDQRMFMDIDMREFLRQSWNKKELQPRAKNLLTFINHFNKTSMVVQTSILRVEQQKDRTHTLSFWIEVAEHLRTIGNYSGLMAVLSALLSTPVNRLVLTWGSLGYNTLQSYHELERLVKSSMNYKELRSAVELHHGACLPYIGYFLTDLTMIEDGSVSHVGHSTNLINFAKWRLLAHTLDRISICHKHPFNLTPVEPLQEFILSLECAESDDVLYKWSLALEERGLEAPSQSQLVKQQALEKLASYKELIDRKKKRFQTKAGIGVDVVYITDRVIAMGFPSRYQLKKLTSFLESTHPDHYHVFNFCAEHSYDKAKFRNRVTDLPITKNSTPTLAFIDRFLNESRKWLEANPRNIVALHCKGNKARSAMMLSCWLLANGKCFTSSHAQQFLDEKFTYEIDYFPSQTRYVSYEEIVIKDPPRPQQLRLSSIKMYTIPVFDKKGSCEPFFSIGRGGKEIFQSKSLGGKQGVEMVEFDCGHQMISDDVLIQYYHKRISVPMFSFAFHTAFVKNERLKLFQRDIDGAHTDRVHRHFHKDFRLELVFENLKTSKSTRVPLEALLSSKPYEEALSKFLVRNGGHNILQLYKRTREFGELPASTPPIELQSTAQNIIRSHSDDIAPETLQQIKANLGNPTLKLLERANVQAKLTLDSQLLPKFLVSNTYNNVTEPLPVSADQIPAPDGLIGTCAQCLLPMTIKDASVAIGEFMYHWLCVSCQMCQKKLDSRTCVIKQGKACCAACEPDMFLPCFACPRKITTKSYQMLISDNGDRHYWHAECFHCVECAYSLKLQLIERRLYCKVHAKKLLQSGGGSRVVPTTAPAPVPAADPDLLESADKAQSDEEGEELDDDEDDELAPPPNVRLLNAITPSHAAEEHKRASVALPLVPVSQPLPPAPDITPAQAAELASATLSPVMKVRADEYILCSACNQRITDSYIVAERGSYHTNCFVCSYCKAVIATQYALKWIDEQEKKFEVFCVRHSYMASSIICKKCNGWILPRSDYVVVGESEIELHSHCFICEMCTAPLTRYKEIDQKFYCSNCLKEYRRREREQQELTAQKHKSPRGIAPAPTPSASVTPASPVPTDRSLAAPSAYKPLEVPPVTQKPPALHQRSESSPSISQQSKAPSSASTSPRVVATTSTPVLSGSPPVPSSLVAASRSDSPKISAALALSTAFPGSAMLPVKPLDTAALSRPTNPPLPSSTLRSPGTSPRAMAPRDEASPRGPSQLRKGSTPPQDGSPPAALTLPLAVTREALTPPAASPRSETTSPRVPLPKSQLPQPPLPTRALSPPLSSSPTSPKQLRAVDSGASTLRAGAQRAAPAPAPPIPIPGTIGPNWTPVRSPSPQRTHEPAIGSGGWTVARAREPPILGVRSAPAGKNHWPSEFGAERRNSPKTGTPPLLSGSPVLSRDLLANVLQMNSAASTAAFSTGVRTSESDSPKSTSLTNSPARAVHERAKPLHVALPLAPRPAPSKPPSEPQSPRSDTSDLISPLSSPRPVSPLPGREQTAFAPFEEARANLDRFDERLRVLRQLQLSTSQRDIANLLKFCRNAKQALHGQMRGVLPAFDVDQNKLPTERWAKAAAYAQQMLAYFTRCSVIMREHLGTIPEPLLPALLQALSTE